MPSLQAGLPGVEALLLQSEDSARSSLPSYLTKAASREALGAKCFLWLFFKSLEWTQPILSYYFRRKSAVNPDQVLEKSVQHFRVSVLSSYLKFGSQVASVNKQPLALLLLLLFTAFKHPAGGKNRLALVLRNLQLTFSHSKTRASTCITPPSPPSLSLWALSLRTVLSLTVIKAITRGIRSVFAGLGWTWLSPSWQLSFPEFCVTTGLVSTYLGSYWAQTSSTMSWHGLMTYDHHSRL